MHFSVTIDTEIDKSVNWRVSSPPSYTGIFQGVRQLLQPLFEAKGVKPVYFLSNEILASKELSSIFRRYYLEGRAELGTHLHYEAAGPYAFGSIDGKHLAGVQAFLPEEEERVALQWLTETFERRFAHRPVSFRAGRFGLGERSIKILKDLGYRVDSSVTPGLCWKFFDGRKEVICDYRAAPNDPYDCDPYAPGQPGTGGIVEIPISVEKSALSPYEVGRLIAGRPRRSVWARPRFASKAELTAMVKRAARRRKRDGLLVMMFHNMEVIPGKSPYSRTKEEADILLSEIMHFIDTAFSYGLKPTTFHEYISDIAIQNG